MKQERDGAGSAGRVVAVLALLAALGGIARVLVQATHESNDGNFAGARQTLIFGGVALGVVVILCGGVALALVPGEIRESALRKAFPDAIVLKARWNPDLVALLSQRPSPAVDPTKLRGIAFAMVTNGSGISFWTGTRHPRKVADFPWQTIDGLSVGTLRLSATRSVWTARLVILDSADQPQFALGSKGWNGAFPQTESTVKKWVDVMERLRANSADH
jgi:hypothetical protein